MKKMLIMLLCVALLAGLAVPALAHDEYPPDPRRPVITQELSPHITSFRTSLALWGRNPWVPVHLNLQAHIPNGDPIGFRWYRDGDYMGSTTTPHAILHFNLASRPFTFFSVVVYNRNHPYIQEFPRSAIAETYSTTWCTVQRGLYAIWRVLRVAISVVLWPTLLMMTPMVIAVWVIAMRLTGW
ncbi:MAG: hypothetical protein FWD06_05455 [Oscillospiraceae bacterium]|nr:hypothetical protein [Oscillospiraceae bacterium]